MTPGSIPEHPSLGAAGNQSRRRGLWIEAAVARPVLGVEYAYLALEAEYAPIHVWFAHEHAGVVHQVSCGEIVGAVDHYIVIFNNIHGVLRCEHFVICSYLYV